jgi:hypothetical protein
MSRFDRNEKSKAREMKKESGSDPETGMRIYGHVERTLRSIGTITSAAFDAPEPGALLTAYFETIEATY